MRAAIDPVRRSPVGPVGMLDCRGARWRVRRRGALPSAPIDRRPGPRRRAPRRIAIQDRRADETQRLAARSAGASPGTARSPARPATPSSASNRDSGSSSGRNAASGGAKRRSESGHSAIAGPARDAELHVESRFGVVERTKRSVWRREAPERVRAQRDSDACRDQADEVVNAVGPIPQRPLRPHRERSGPAPAARAGRFSQ